MPVTLVVGAAFGDEGKGRIVDLLLARERHQLAVRFQGGANAGHTVIDDRGKQVLHQLPVGVLAPGVTSVLGPGVALDLPRLCAELDALSASGRPVPKLVIPERAQLVLEHHRALDRLEEERLGARAIGSTRSGIAPAYADKYARLGVTAGDLRDEPYLMARIAHSLAQKNVLFEHLYGAPRLSVQEVAAPVLQLRERVLPLLADTTALLRRALDERQSVLCEGQLGALKDPDHGVYPFVTASSPLAAFAAIGAGVPLAADSRVIAVTKAYTTTVGAGPFPTELGGAEGDELRRRGGDAGEIGATTGRPRRVGWLDTVATRYGASLQGATEVAVTCLDVLGYLEEIPLCVGYELDGQRTTSFPCTRALARARPVYELLPGWKTPLRGLRRRAELPRQAERYVTRLEELLEVPVRLVSTGPQRDDVLEWR